jgi:hypothetical protein
VVPVAQPLDWAVRRALQAVLRSTGILLVALLPSQVVPGRALRLVVRPVWLEELAVQRALVAQLRSLAVLAVRLPARVVRLRSPAVRRRMEIRPVERRA